MAVAIVWGERIKGQIKVGGREESMASWQDRGKDSYSEAEGLTGASSDRIEISCIYCSVMEGCTHALIL